MDAIQKIAITKIKGVGPKSIRSLLAYFGSVDEVFQATRSQLARVPGVSRLGIEELLSKSCMDEAEREYIFAQQLGVEILWHEDQSYPRRLRSCADAPILLFSKGNADLNRERVISVVGTRNASSYGRKCTEQLLQDLLFLEDLMLVSGLAFGIDIIAHRKAIREGMSNVAVLAHGLDRVYPQEHAEAADQILENGRLLTEFPLGSLPDRMNFPMRNRIIAGLSDVTVLVEAAHKGGALITAEMASSYNRDVCAFPGQVDQLYSQGCNELIRKNKAFLIRHAGDLIELMSWAEEQSAVANGKQLDLLLDLTTEEQLLFDYLREVPQAAVDELAIHCDWPQSKLAIILLEMEMKGIICALPGKLYKLP